MKGRSIIPQRDERKLADEMARERGKDINPSRTKAN